jgi:hypothetical protein
MNIEKLEEIKEKLSKQQLCRVEVRYNSKKESTISRMGYLSPDSVGITIYEAIDNKGLYRGDSINLSAEEIVNFAPLVENKDNICSLTPQINELFDFYKKLKSPYCIELVHSVDKGIIERLLGYVMINDDLILSPPREDAPVEYRERFRKNQENPCFELSKYLDWNFLPRGELLSISFNRVLGVSNLVENYD